MIQAILSFFKKAAMVITFCVTILPLLTSLYNFIKVGVALVPTFARYYLNAAISVLLFNVIRKYTGGGE